MVIIEKSLPRTPLYSYKCSDYLGLQSYSIFKTILKLLLSMRMCVYVCGYVQSGEAVV